MLLLDSGRTAGRTRYADLKNEIFNRLLFLVAKECISDLFLNLLHRYGGAKLLTHLKAITVSLY